MTGLTKERTEAAYKRLMEQIPTEYAERVHATQLDIKDGRSLYNF